jgi:NAD(P)-dependent dehydrogenase (short-subunit alcohol dehydrogenase family)
MLRLPPSRHANPFRPTTASARTHCFGGRPGDAHHGDLATVHGAAAVYTEANKAFGGIDILINNAGAYEARPWICS